MTEKNLSTTKLSGFEILARTDCGVNFVSLFEKLIAEGDAFPHEILGGDPVNGNVRKISFGGKNYVLKYECKKKDRVENAVKSFFRGSHFARLIRRVAHARECGFFNCSDIYLIAERKIFGVVRESYLLTEFVEGKMLNDLENGGGALKCELIDLFTRMHAFGIVSGDVHPFNFFQTERGIVAIDLPGKKASALEKAEDWKMLEVRCGVDVPADVRRRLGFWFKILDWRMRVRNFSRFLRGKEISLWTMNPAARKFRENEWTHCDGWKIKIAAGAECSLESILRLIGKTPDEILQNGRERVAKMRFRIGGNEHVVVVKRYTRQGFFQSRSALFVGSKAERAFRAAQVLRERGVGTPRAIAVAERWEGKRLAESFLVTEFVPALTNFRDELFRIYRDEANCAALIPLLQNVATACRAFHDCGIVHRDLGNQNIALTRGNAGWNVLFIDLDRVRFAERMTDAQRGKDLARIDLPSDFLRIFFVMYFNGYAPPAEFFEAEISERKAFARHSASRLFRHPIREWRIRRAGKHAAEISEKEKKGVVPVGRDLWIWDEKSAQAVSPYMSKERRKFRSIRTISDPLFALLKYGVPAWRIFRKFIKAPARKCVPDYRSGVGMSLDPNPETWEMQLKFLRELQSNDTPENADFRMPVLLRIYHHKPEFWEWTLDRARELFADGHAVAFALVQDRKALTCPSSWEKMVALVFARTEDFADFIEVGHAINRSKWGIWEPSEYRKLLVPVIEQKKRFPHVKITGPACIDFDLHSLAAAMNSVPEGFRFDALSHHLYVDRRGAPENFQGRFDTHRKCALIAVFAKVFETKEEKFIVSEVNWPLLGAGEYSPVDSPFVNFGPWETRPAAPWVVEPPRVSEDDYAEFMVRYLSIVLSGGFVSRVYWWRLCSRGFGLVDDSDPEAPRPRSAFFKLQQLLRP